MERTVAVRQFLRRNDVRRPVRCSGMIECRGMTRAVDIIDFSNSGLRVDHVTGLGAGDEVMLLLTPQLSVAATIAWLVWHKAGLRFLRPLSAADPVHVFLTAEAAKLDVARVRAITALAQQDATRLQSNGGS